MAERRVTQSDVAGVLGLTQPAIARRLNGLVPFDVNELAAVALLLDISEAFLLLGAVA